MDSFSDFHSMSLGCNIHDSVLELACRFISMHLFRDGNCMLCADYILVLFWEIASLSEHMDHLTRHCHQSGLCCVLRINCHLFVL